MTERIREYAMSHPMRTLTLTADDRSAAENIVRALKLVPEDECPAYKVNPARWIWPNGAELVIRIPDPTEEAS